ncbi:unnamed protein product [Boreogadus saida]
MSRSREVWRRVTDEHAVLLVSPQVAPDVSKPAGFQQKCSSAIRYDSAGTVQHEYSTLTLDSASDGGLSALCTTPKHSGFLEACLSEERRGLS